jgi:hypothetical protein
MPSAWIIQGALFALSAAAITLLSGRSRYARWGWWLGLASQPFWLIETLRAEQWGMAALSVYYTGVWVRGVRNHALGRAR